MKKNLTEYKLTAQGRLLVSLAVLDGTRLVGNDLRVCGLVGTIERQVEEWAISRSMVWTSVAASLFAPGEYA